MGSATSGQVVLVCIRKHTEQLMGNKSVGSNPPWLLPLPLFESFPQ